MLRPKILITLLITILIIFAIPLTLILIKNNQDIRQHAQSVPTNVDLNPSVTPTDTVTIKGHYVDKDGKDLFLSGQEVRLYLSNDANNIIGSFVDSSQSSPTWSFPHLPRDNYRIIARSGYAGYSLSYSVCADCTTHTTYQAVEATTDALNFLKHPSSKYVDIYYKYSLDTQTTTPTATAKTTLTISVKLHGIGNAGDSLHTSGGNKTPIHTRRYVNLRFLTSSGAQVTTAGDIMDYDPTSQSFKSTVTLPDTLATGSYNVAVNSPSYGETVSTSPVTIQKGQENTLPVITLAAGDVTGDHKIDLFDYNTIMDCWLQNARCTMELKAASDLDDNGVVDAADYNLFFREMNSHSPSQ